MSVDSWQEVWAIFEGALERPPAQRQAFLAEACGRELELRRAVEDLLAADRETDSFLDRPFAPALGAPELEPHPSVRRLPEGTLIGPYRILRRCGQGGTSTVYLSERADGAFPRRVAIKLVRPGMESEILGRLRTERRILAGRTGQGPTRQCSSRSGALRRIREL